MKIAVISDSHDNKDKIVKAVAVMNERKIDVLIHCGDFIAPFVKRWFDGLNENIKNNFYGVFGNNDGERVMLKQVLGQICDIPGLELITEIDGKKIFASHMPTPETLDALANSQKFDIILRGHTHEIINKKYANGVLVVNPGEACGYLTGKGSFAIIDTKTDDAEIIYL